MHPIQSLLLSATLAFASHSPAYASPSQHIPATGLVPAQQPSPTGMLPPADGIKTCSVPNPGASGITYELIVGKYLDADGAARPGEPFPCDSMTPAVTSTCDPYAGCPSDAVYTQFLGFRNKDAKGSHGGLVYLAVTGKCAEINAIASLLEKDATYRFCAYIPDHQPLSAKIGTYYRFHPYFTPRRLSGVSNGQ